MRRPIAGDKGSPGKITTMRGRQIDLWFDGGGRFGYGNIRRCVELGEFLKRRGHEVRFVPLSENASALCPAVGGPVVGGDLMVLDVPYEGDALVRRARASGAKVVALDFDGTEPPDLVISLQSVRRVPAQCRSLCGVEYAIIREEIRALGSGHESVGEGLVIVGGGDQDGLTRRITERLPDVSLCVVQGPAGPALHLERENLRVVADPPDLPGLMAGCAWAVTTGGTTMLEMLFLGKAIHVVPRTGAEQVFARHFAERGALLGLGLEGLVKPGQEQIRACQPLGPRLVDGRGCERIAAEIEILL